MVSIRLSYPKALCCCKSLKHNLQLHILLFSEKAKAGKAALSGAEDEATIPHEMGGRWCRCVDAIKGSGLIVMKHEFFDHMDLNCSSPPFFPSRSQPVLWRR